jgi:hypothetical protein
MAGEIRRKKQRRLNIQLFDNKRRFQAVDEREMRTARRVARKR